MRFELVHATCSVVASCEASATARTGVEMEALHGVSGALLAIYDLSKAVDPVLAISDVHLSVKERQEERALESHPGPVGETVRSEEDDMLRIDVRLFGALRKYNGAESRSRCRGTTVSALRRHLGDALRRRPPRSPTSRSWTRRCWRTTADPRRRAAAREASTTSPSRSSPVCGG